MVVSIDPREKNVAMLSIPRDLYVYIPDYGYNKINVAYAFGEERKTNGDGAALSKEVIGQILDIPIHYYVRLDFEGFRKVIDILGGVTVKVEKNIYDYQYPNDRGGYDPFTIKAGTYNMDGDLALRYARSRKSSSDFDRAKRQQQILVAVKEKALTLDILLNPAKITSLINTLGAHVRTDLQVWEMERLRDLAREIDSTKVKSEVLDNSRHGLLYATHVGGMYVLRPIGNNFTKIKQFAHELFTDSYIKQEAAKIALQNGTFRNNIATNLGKILKSYGYDITSVSRAEKKNYKKTIIYDYSGGKKIYTVTFLARRLDAQVVRAYKKDQDIDLKIILGEDYVDPFSV